MQERWLVSTRCSALMVLLLGTGCGPRSDSTEAPRPDETAAPAPANVTDVPSTVTISGRLRAHDGSPLDAGEVTVQGGFGDFAASLDETGTFSLEVPRGVVVIWLAGVDHAPSARRTLLTGPLSIDGTLGTYSRPSTEPDLEIIGQFLDAEGQPVGAAPRSAARVQDGVHQLDLSGHPETATELRYQLRSAGGRPVNGPLADRYVYSGRGSFSSIVELDDRAEIQLDLSTMPPGRSPADIRWSGEDDVTVAIFEFERRWKKALRELAGASESPPDPTRVAALQAEARAEVDAVADPALQGLLRGVLAAVFSSEELGDGRDPESVHAEAAWFVEHVAPDDIHLALIHGIDSTLLASLESGADAEQVARIHAWFERCGTDNPELDAALGALSTLLRLAEQDQDEARLAELVVLLEDARFEGHRYRDFLYQQSANKPLARGKTLPPFEYSALPPAAESVDSRSRAGRIYLMEYWATWCKPCVEDMPNLHAAYAAVNGVKLSAGDDRALRTLAPVADPVVEFVFVSFDTKPDEIVAFREEQWAMPWTHAYVESERQRSTMEALGFSGLPTSVLVDGEGTILAIGGELHGERLLPTLERVLAESGAGG